MIGYHGTADVNIDEVIKDILNNGFVYKHRENHWLGQGIYFFEDDFWAYQWCNQDISKEKCVLKSQIICTEDKFWDLSLEKFKRKFTDEVKEILRLLEEKGQTLDSTDSDVQRCYYLDIIKKKKKLEVIKCIFELRNNPNPVMRALRVINTQVQICVTKNENIENTCVHKRCSCGERIK